MPRKFFKRYMPSVEKVRQVRALHLFGDALFHPSLWHLNRRSAAGGVAVGLFCGLIPGPLQMLGAALLAVPLRKNLPVALLMTLYTNPLTIVPLYVLAYGYGKLLLGGHWRDGNVQPFAWDWTDWSGSARALLDWMLALGPPLAVGLLALALTLAAAGYVAVQLAWRAYVILQWRARRRRRQR
jgi:hypothetical protein